MGSARLRSGWSISWIRTGEKQWAIQNAKSLTLHQQRQQEQALRQSRPLEKEYVSPQRYLRGLKKS
jgi:hypothetical protein